MKIERYIVSCFDNKNNEIEILGICPTYNEAHKLMLTDYKATYTSLIDENECVTMNYHDNRSAEIHTSDDVNYCWNINTKTINIPIDEIKWSISEIVDLLDGLNDDDFYEVLMTLAHRHDCSDIDHLGDWIKQTLWEIEERKDEN